METVRPDAEEFWWSPARHAARRPRLLARNRLKAALRGYFADADFVEVEAAQLQRSPAAETHLHGLRVAVTDMSGAKAEAFLHTSPEMACKKLLAAGETRIFDFARVFRDRERGRLHSPEFTMLEWYRAHEPYEALMEDCAAILSLAAGAGGLSHWSFRGLEMEPLRVPERLTVADAFMRFAGVDLAATYSTEATDRDALAAAASASGVRVSPDDSWSDIFSKALTERVEPRLGAGRATILCEYPWPEAALARRKPGDPMVAERFELYACGVELANAFGELTDAREQRARLEADMALRQAIYGERHPIDESFLAAVARMPDASGAALGFDRLVMLATGAESVAEVLWTPPHDPFAEGP